MSKFWKEPQNVIAIGVTLISVCALIVSITQTRIMIRQSELMDTQARASVRPILYFGRAKAFDPQTRQLINFRMGISNRGVGPASIDDISVEYFGKVVHNWGELFESLNLHDSIPTHANTSQFNKMTVQPGQEIIFLDLSDNITLGRAVYGALDSLKVKILYSSIYGDQFEGSITPEGWVNEALDQEKKSFGIESFKD